MHYCLGASLAKLEASTAITSLIRRFPDVELAGEPGWRDRLTIRGVDHLPAVARLSDGRRDHRPRAAQSLASRWMRLLVSQRLPPRAMTCA